MGLGSRSDLTEKGTPPPFVTRTRSTWHTNMGTLRRAKEEDHTPRERGQ